jgi:transposase-like protein
MVLPDRQKETVQPVIKKHIQAGAALYTDEMLGYRGLAGEYAQSSREPCHMWMGEFTPMASKTSGPF